MNGKPETGLKLDNTFGISDDFFKRGVITACLKDEGTIPELRDSFMISFIGIMTLIVIFKN